MNGLRSIRLADVRLRPKCHSLDSITGQFIDGKIDAAKVQDKYDLLWKQEPG